MKYKLYRKLDNTIEISDSQLWNTEKVKLEGDELIDFLYDNLVIVMKGILDPDTAGRKPDKYLENLQKGRLGDFSKRYIIRATDDDKTIALLIALPDKEGMIHIYTVGVDEAYRQKGVASSIIKRFVDDHINSGYDEVVLDVHEENKAAIALYEKLGFLK